MRRSAVPASLGASFVFDRLARSERFGFASVVFFLPHLLSGRGSLWFASHRPQAAHTVGQRGHRHALAGNLRLHIRASWKS